MDKKEKKYLRSSHLDSKREIACFHVETVTGNREKWRENRGHVVIFAVRVSRLRDAKSLFFSRTGQPDRLVRKWSILI